MKSTERDLGRLMQLSQQGDKQAYTILLQHCTQWLSRYFSHRIAPIQLDDLVQETLIAIHRKRASFDPQRPFYPWLAAIARYKWVDQLRRQYRRNETELEDDFEADGDENDMAARISLDRLLAQLPAKQAHVIRMVKIDGYSVSDAATHTGQSESLVKVNIHRGLKRLATLVESDT